MSQITDFRKELVSLQVMSPERDSSRFVHLLQGSSNYDIWKMEFKSVMLSTFIPLKDYYDSATNTITDLNNKPITDKNILTQTREIYNSILLGMLRSSVSVEIRKSIGNLLTKSMRQRPDYAKDIISEIDEKYGKLNFRTAYELFANYINLKHSEDGDVITKVCNAFMDLVENRDLLKCCTFLEKGSPSTKKELLKRYGSCTSIDTKEFYGAFMETKQEEKLEEGAYVAGRFKQKNRRPYNRRKFCKKGNKTHKGKSCEESDDEFEEHVFFAAEERKYNSKSIEPSVLIAKNPKSNDIKTRWYLDSGCTTHIGNNMKDFTELELGCSVNISGLSDSVTSQGKGTMETQRFSLKNALYVPSAPCNLVSVSKITEMTGCQIIFSTDGAYLSKLKPSTLKKSKKIGSVKNGLYELKLEFSKEKSFWLLEDPPQLDFEDQKVNMDKQTTLGTGEHWHARFGHPGRMVYQMLSKSTSLPKLQTPKSSLCSTCILTKGKIRKGHTSDIKVSIPLELIQVDICGGFRYKDYVDSKYFLTIIDKFSNYYDVIPLTTKSHATRELMNWIRRVENHFENHGGYKVSHVRTDNGGEFTGKILHEFFASKGITHELTVPYSSSQNGAVARAHCVLQTKVRSLLIGGRVPPYLWSEALLCAAYSHNHLPVTGSKGKIPYVYWNNIPNVKLNYFHSRIFGCAAYVKLHPALREGKLLPTSICGIMVGYETNRKGYRIYLPQLKKVITAKDVRFDENVFPLAISKESHAAYDFATGTLPGAPKYPPSDYNTQQ